MHLGNDAWEWVVKITCKFLALITCLICSMIVLIAHGCKFCSGSSIRIVLSDGCVSIAKRRAKARNVPSEVDQDAIPRFFVFCSTNSINSLPVLNCLALTDFT